MKRREFIEAAGSVLARMPFSAQAQQPPTTKRIGILANLRLPPIQRFLKKLSQLGYEEGRNLLIEYRFGEGRDDRLPALAAELAAIPVDVIVVWGTPAAYAAKKATTTLPFSIGAAGDVVNTGLITNIARPEANLTGFVALNIELEEKRIELLKEVLPNMTCVAVRQISPTQLAG